MTVLKIDGLIYSVTLDKKRGVANILITTRKIFNSDLKRIFKSGKPVPVNIDIELQR